MDISGNEKDESKRVVKANMKGFQTVGRVCREICIMRASSSSFRSTILFSVFSRCNFALL